jgi:class 3 adenylate cyclase
MTERRIERRLAAILAADAAGYSRLVGEDEEGTLERLKVLRRTVADPKIKEHRGRVVRTMGDGPLVEFASVVDAVRCAVDVQREMTQRNADFPADRRIEFRIGINLGDIIKDGRKSTVMASMSSLASKRWRPRAVSASAAWCATRCATSSVSPSTIGASSGSITSLAPSAYSM